MKESLRGGTKDMKFHLPVQNYYGVQLQSIKSFILEKNMYESFHY